MEPTMPTQVFTKTDTATSGWAIDDDVIQLRRWGTDAIHPLPLPPTDECTIGAAEACDLRLNDPSGRVSRLHARLVRVKAKWLLRDARSKNGVRADGLRRGEIFLEPGLEIRLGGITLIAESIRSNTLRAFLARLLGWDSSRIEFVDHALRVIRSAATRRVALVLCGDGDLVPTAHLIHRHVRGPDRPFVVCDPRRQPGEATVRSAKNCTTGMEALAAAYGGTLCVRGERLPGDIRKVMEAVLSPGSRVQLVMCAESLEDRESYDITSIGIPRLATRAAELDRIISEYADDAMLELGTQRSGFPEDDHAWVREHACTSLPDIEKATLRLVALRASRTVAEAAARLGMAPVSLARWIGRHRLPTQIVQ
jgi:hypothetical protein